MGDDPAAIVTALLDALRAGACVVEIAGAVTYAAALRIARFHITNDFNDWDTALHSFSFSNAIQQGLARSVSMNLVRGVFDAAMTVYLNRFLNIPAAPLPNPVNESKSPDAILAELPVLLEKRQQVNE